MDAKSGYFFIRWHNKMEPSSLPWILYSRWQPRSQILTLARREVNLALRILLWFWTDSAIILDANFAHFTTHALLPIFPKESWVVEWIRLRVGYVWTGKFDLNRDTCGRENFWIRRETFALSSHKIFYTWYARVKSTSESVVSQLSSRQRYLSVIHLLLGLPSSALCSRGSNYFADLKIRQK